MIGVAIVGAGLMGEVHARNLCALGDRARLRVVCDLVPGRAARLAAEVGAEATSDLAAALADTAVDAVAICLPPDLNREAAERALAAGKHVFVEKPIAVSDDDATAILRAAERHRRTLMVGHVLRFWPGYAEIHRRVASGELGRALAVATQRLQPPPGWADWMADPRRSGGVPAYVLVHDLDQANWLLGRARRAYARPVRREGDAAPGHVLALVEYDNAEAAFEAGTIMPASFPFASSIRVLCERGALEYAFGGVQPEEPEGEEDAAERYRPAGAGLVRVYPPRPGPPEEVPLPGFDLWQAELVHFLERLEQGREPEQGTGEQAREALLVALAVSRSLESGRPEPVG